tara:strand:- start:3073 stop:4017 length:945 start_codon:yes stop_codon:yes gene_type:complete
MNLFQLYKYKKNLSKEQQALLMKKKVNASMLVHKLIKLFHKSSIFDRVYDEIKLPFWKIVLYILLPFYFIIVIIYIAMGNVEPSLYFTVLLPIGFISLILAGIIYGIYRLIRHILIGGSDLNNNLRGLVFPLLNVLKEDVAPNKKLKIQMNAHPLDAKENFQNKERLPVAGRVRSIIAQHYLLPFCALSVPLKDGSILNLGIEQSLTKLNISKVSIRGKRKTKVKFKLKNKIEIKHLFPKGHYKLAEKGASPSQSKIGEVLSQIAIHDKGEYIMVGSTIKAKVKGHGSSVPELIMPFNDLLSIITNSFKRVQPI